MRFEQFIKSMDVAALSGVQHPWIMVVFQGVSDPWISEIAIRSPKSMDLAVSTGVQHPWIMVVF